VTPPTTDFRPIRFFHRGRTVEVNGAEPTRTVLQWLRDDARCTGTKEGCAEGDCGACTVVVGELDAEGALQLLPVNSCIRLLPTLDGKALFTVEDLAAGGALHPVQQALVDGNGSQCGFCTPGFVMSLFAVYERGLAQGPPSRQQLADALSGNLCRCTGYRPILDAGARMFELPPRPLDRAPVVSALHALRSDPPLALPGPGGGYRAPRKLADFASLRLAHPEAHVLAGCTDIGLWITKQLRELPGLIFVGEVAELTHIEVGADGTMSIGAAVSLETGWQALAERWPGLAELWQRFASPPVRHAGTLVGNLANGSPIGDTAPALIALDARLLLQRGERLREVPLADFYTGYMKNSLEPGEFVRAALVPAPREHEVVRGYKISKRFDSDISAVCAGLAITLQGDTVVSARIAFGGMAATVKRAMAAEAAMAGRPWSEATMRDAAAALASDFTPLSDLRASAGYRMQVARNLLHRFWFETRPSAALPAAAVNVRAPEAVR